MTQNLPIVAVTSATPGGNLAVKNAQMRQLGEKCPRAVSFSTMSKAPR